MKESSKSFYVFADDSAKPLSRHGLIRHQFESAVKKAGLEDFHFHDLRHTFASHLVMSGYDLLTVKELLGHQSLRMTERYAHLFPDHKKFTIQLLPKENCYNSATAEN